MAPDEHTPARPDDAPGVAVPASAVSPANAEQPTNPAAEPQPTAHPDNAALADIIERGAAVAEPEALLAALVDYGVFVPVNAEHSIVFMEGSDGAPALPGYTGAAVCRAALPQAVPVHCDGSRLLDIGARTGVRRILVSTAEQWAVIPMGMVMRVLHERGMRTAGERQMRLSRSAHPFALALRDATARRILDFPGVVSVWIADALWTDSGLEQLMLHVALAPDAAPDTRERLMSALLTEEIEPPADGPQLGVRTLDLAAEAAVIAQLDALGLDTVRADHATGKVEVVSVDYD